MHGAHPFAHALVLPHVAEHFVVKLIPRRIGILWVETEEHKARDSIEHAHRARQGARERRQAVLEPPVHVDLEPAVVILTTAGVKAGR